MKVVCKPEGLQRITGERVDGMWRREKRKQLLDDLNEKRRYWNLEREAKKKII